MDSLNHCWHVRAWYAQRSALNAMRHYAHMGA